MCVLFYRYLFPLDEITRKLGTTLTELPISRPRHQTSTTTTTTSGVVFNNTNTTITTNNNSAITVVTNLTNSSTTTKVGNEPTLVHSTEPNKSNNDVVMTDVKLKDISKQKLGAVVEKNVSNSIIYPKPEQSLEKKLTKDENSVKNSVRSSRNKVTKNVVLERRPNRKGTTKVGAFTFFYLFV